MLHKLLQILLILSISALIYLGNTILITVCLFLLLLFSMLNKNYFSLLSIIPLFFINQKTFIIFLFIWLALYFISTKVKRNIIKNSMNLLVTLIYVCFELLFNNVELKILLYILIIISVVLLVNLYSENLSNQLTINVLILSVSILNIEYINEYIFLLIFSIFVITDSISFRKSYYIVTAFFITIYAIVKTENLVYINIQIFAYLGYLLNYLKISNSNNGDLEFVLEDININITNFCNFLNHFTAITYNSDYERRVSSSIKILIESYCLTCKNRTICYANKKIKTYIYLKDLLTKKEQINSRNDKSNFFECKYYFNMAEKALSLQKQYDLIADSKIEDLKLFGICSSIQNYFISMFEKISPEMFKLMKFKKNLIDQNINFSHFDHTITSETIFQFKIFANKMVDLLLIVDSAKIYFRRNNVNIDLRESYVCIYPKKSFKVQYDSASLSLDNCQISGDNILFKTLNDVNFICALSDGMGSGYHAYQLSQETLKMVDNITNCSISFDTSLQILNEFFKTRDLSDSYATLDFVDINLTDGVLNLYKLGSSTTYISRGNKIIPIYNNSLPFGISDLITKEEYSISNGDLIILVSDGINDYISEEILIKFIDSIKDEAPHKIVYEILQKIYYENGNTIKDDMSCVAIKIKSV